MSTRLEVALQIREAALQKLRAEGEFEEIHRVGSVLSWKAPDWQQGGIHMLHRTPFQKLPKPSAEVMKTAFEYGLEPRLNLPYGLDIWAGGKVMNLEWNDSGDIKLVSFKRGAWEQIVLGFGQHPNGPRGDA